MARTSSRRIPVAQEFVRIGFGDAIDDSASFYSHDFLTQELTTTEVQAVLPIVKQYNAFAGDRVATAIEKFRGRVSGWKFGCAGSPLLLVVLPYSTNQVEEHPPAGKGGTTISNETHESLIKEMRQLFIEELNADKFEPDDESNHVYGAWWD